MKHKREPWKGAAAGLIGGAAGTAVMEAYWKALNVLAGKDLRKEKAKQPGPLDEIAVVPPVQKRGESSTATVGRLAYESLTGRQPEKDTKEALSKTVHWGYGIGQGAVYGALHEEARLPDPAAGALFGSALWGFSELGLPVLGLGKGPTASAPATHLATFGAHLVYGLTVSAVTRLLRDFA